MRFLLICIYTIIFTFVASAQKKGNAWGDGTNCENDKEYVANRARLSNLATKHRRDSLCHKYTDSIYSEAFRRNDRKGCAIAITSKALSYIHENADLDSVKFWTDSVRNYSRRHDLPRYYYFMWSQYINALLGVESNKRKAKEELDQMLIEATSEHYIVGQIECCRLLARLYSYFDMREKEYEMRIKQIELTEEYDPTNTNLPIYYTEMARACIATDRFDEAAMYLDRGDNVATTDLSKIQLLRVRMELAVREDNKEEVLLIAQKVKKQGFTDRYGQKKMIEMYAHTYSGEYDQADSILLLLCKQKDIDEREHISSKLLIATKDTTNSYKGCTARDMLKYQEIVDSISRLRLKLLVEDSDLKMNLAVLETEKLNMKLQADALRYHIVFVVSLFSLVVALILVYYANRLRKTNHQLSENQAALVHQKEIAEQANEMKAEVIRNMSHEIRTPLNAVVGFSEVLSQLADKNAREQIELSNKIQESTNDLLDILNSVIDMSDLETSLSMEIKDNIPINLFCSNLIEKYHKEEVRGVSSRFYPLDNECIIKTNERCLRIAVDALLSNAYKFTNNGYVELSIHRTGNSIKIEVVDTGCGLTPEQLSKAFDRFYKGDVFTQGIGLGLPLCRLALNKIGATVEIKPIENGTGTYAAIYLPNLSIYEG
ncbi:MAG: HAMP domain-containing sensor histidine kinase [Bacteroidia bacterium]|nr:HAMP domain-containing sensor histidine kinase [Bacteroidia bacterium]